MIRGPVARIGILAVVSAMGLAACGENSQSASPVGSPDIGASTEPSVEVTAAPTTEPSDEASAEPSTPALDLGGAASDVSELSAYQLDISVTGAEGGDQEMTVLATRDPVTATHYSMAGFELITIEGQGAWINQGGTWTVAPGGVQSYLPLFDAMAPDNLIGAYSLGLYGSQFRESGSEERNGVQATHYHLDASDIPASAGDFPADGSVDVWIANDGGYLVGLAYSGTDPDTGERIEMTMDVSRVNDASISIEPPI